MHREARITGLEMPMGKSGMDTFGTVSVVVVVAIGDRISNKGIRRVPEFQPGRSEILKA